MTGVDYRNTSLHFNRGIPLTKQYGRTKSTSNYLPVHMQNHNGRLAMNQSTFNTLKANNYRDRGFLDPASTFNMRKDFWVDPKKAK